MDYIPLSVVQSLKVTSQNGDISNFTDEFEQFCGTLAYTLSYTSGSKDVNLITFDK
jgi:hypothetical protein